MNINYDGRTFKPLSTHETGDVNEDTRFHYRQDGSHVMGLYSGGVIDVGHLLGNVHPDGSLAFCYHHVTTDGEIHAGQCTSTPRRDSDGRLHLDEKWQWFTRDGSTGTSCLVEVIDAEGGPEPSGK